MQNRFELWADYRKRGNRTHGLVLITSGPLSFGIERRDQETILRPFDARDWFEEAERSFH